MAYSADPDKHRRATGFLAGAPIPDADESTLSNVLIQPLLQQRQLSIAPREVSPDELANIFRESLENW
jgi:hydroxyacid-oxoacid transhydrogenase